MTREEQLYVYTQHSLSPLSIFVWSEQMSCWPDPCWAALLFYIVDWEEKQLCLTYKVTFKVRKNKWFVCVVRVCVWFVGLCAWCVSCMVSVYGLCVVCVWSVHVVC